MTGSAAPQRNLSFITYPLSFEKLNERFLPTFEPERTDQRLFFPIPNSGLIWKKGDYLIREATTTTSCSGVERFGFQLFNDPDGHS